MTYKQIEASREIRLWVTQVILPVLGIGTVLVTTNPELRDKIATNAKSVKDKINLKLHK